MSYSNNIVHSHHYVRNIENLDETFFLLAVLKPTWDLPMLEVQFYQNGTSSSWITYTPIFKDGREMYVFIVYGNDVYVNPQNLPPLDFLKHITQLESIPQVVATFQNGYVFRMYLDRWFDILPSLPLIAHCFTARRMAHLHRCSLPLDMLISTSPPLWSTIAHYVNSISDVYRLPTVNKTPFQRLAFMAVTDVPYIKEGALRLGSSPVWAYGDFESLDVFYNPDHTVGEIHHTKMSTAYQAFDIADYFMTNLHPLRLEELRQYEYRWLQVYLKELSTGLPFNEYDANSLHLTVNYFCVVNALYYALQALFELEYRPNDMSALNSAKKKLEIYQYYRSMSMFFFR